MSSLLAPPSLPARFIKWYDALRRTGMTGTQFRELGPYPPVGYHAASFWGDTVHDQVNRGIEKCVADNVPYLFISQHMYPLDPALLAYNAAVRLVKEGGPLNWLDVTAYGAEPGNVSQDAGLAFNAARAAGRIDGDVIYVPAGAYKMTTAFSWGSNPLVMMRERDTSFLTNPIPAPGANQRNFELGDTGTTISGTASANNTIRGDGTQWAGSSFLQNTGSAITVGTDPGGTEVVRVAGGIRLAASGAKIAYDNAGGEFDIEATTSDGSDTAVLSLAGGGDDNNARGAGIKIAGNENTSQAGVGGVIDFVGGDVASGGFIRFRTGATAADRWRVAYDGSFLAGTDNVIDIGGSGVNRPRDVNVGRNVNVETAVVVGAAPGGAQSIRVANGALIQGAVEVLSPGMASAPDFTFNGDTNTGMYQVGLDRIGFATTGVARWEITAAGHLITGSDNAFDIGATGATRPRDFHLGRTFVLTQGTATSDTKLIDHSATWDNAGVAFTGWKLNVTNTASVTPSRLVDIQVGGTSRFELKLGTGTTPLLDVTAPVNAPVARFVHNITSGSEGALAISSTINNATSAPALLAIDLANNASSASTALITARVGGSAFFSVARDGQCGILGGALLSTGLRVGASSTPIDIGVSIETVHESASSPHRPLNVIGSGENASAYTTGLVESVRVATYVKHANQTITEWRGLAIEAGPTAGTKYAIRTLGTELSKFGGTIEVPAGGGTAVARPGGTINVNFTDVGNVGTGEDDLMTYSLPASSFNGTNQVIRVRAHGTVAANTNSKTVRFYFGAGNTSLFTTSSSTDQGWDCEAYIIRTGSSTQEGNGYATVYSSSAGTTLHTRFNANFTATDTSAITIKFTADATADNDVVQESMIIEFLNA